MAKNAFTLIELLIVIVIMGVIYTLAISNFSQLSQDTHSLRLDNLKEYLLAQKPQHEAKLICLDDCSSCDVYVDGNKTQSIDGLLDESVKVYRYEQSYGYVQKKEEVFFNKDGIEENVCFLYGVDKSGVGEQVLIEFKNRYYDMSNYFEPLKVYKSVQEAQEAKEELANEVLQ
ncbi:type II secretion system protein [Sulfurimonas sp.]|uniref:pilus assembly FimT family protein n=1 Tax=Sulfurimonas sp. TaxID=2022749 RepID=UPI00260F6BD0|nr:type II secretion system protein [Sulfurimonas sp.]